MIGDEPQSKDPEIIEAERICEEMRDIAKKLPKPSNIKNKGIIEQFGNNFYLLFLTILEEKSNPNLGVIRYLKKTEELYGDNWKKFLENNAELISQIQELLEQQKLFNQLFKDFMILYRSQKTRELGSRINEELNLQGIKNDIWSKLNPLLKQASEAMEKCGLKPEAFMGGKP
ncbi:hypothetical protein A2814_03240 [Candidatus Nomurabacteria bacterium RIFCSPHIGHO2_01_FULL_38_19]|uniref:Uncharacterized protein n=1 Tax=Candidatus Nomurabacteria bacterium RIFCSPHIGHO2_01_FULL_38_19 TaxID=1801732 RepID=A0A1F6UQ94_9BACT|nr:MAG: hypothetical protein A2814_03240 [Candidatus Nomurabacteria bacterium RIFCSPHIGHO2_01_FULL_38_19]